jgi:uncharacterized protein YggE
MSRRSVLATTVAAAVLAAAPAAAHAQDGKTVTATGTGQAAVHPKNRNSSPSIAAAVDSARKAAIGSALSEAHEYALDYAQAVALTLGSVISVSDSQANGFYGPGGSGAFIAPFGPNQYCGTVRRPVGRPVRGKKLKFKESHRCIVPRFAFTTLTVTYAAS